MIRISQGESFGLVNKYPKLTEKELSHITQYHNFEFYF